MSDCEKTGVNAPVRHHAWTTYPPNVASELLSRIPLIFDF